MSYSDHSSNCICEVADDGNTVDLKRFRMSSNLCNQSKEILRRPHKISIQYSNTDLVTINATKRDKFRPQIHGMH